MTTIKPAGQILADEIDKAVADLKGCVTPIFDVNEKGEAELNGSAVLVELSGDVFLCTAGHVLDANANSTLYIDGPSKMEILAGEFSASKEHDAAVLKLTPEQVALLQKYAPLPSDEIASVAETAQCKYAALVGFPETKNRKIYQQNKIKGLIYFVGGMVIEAALARIRVGFSRKRNVDAKTRQPVSAPEPHGMSGGAMFGVGVDAAAIEGKPKPKLIGLMTDCPKSSNEIFGPSAAIILALIRDGWGVSLPTRLEVPKVKPRPTPRSKLASG